jgi:hypothetical protein
VDQHLVAERGVEFTIAKGDGTNVANFILRVGRTESTGTLVCALSMKARVGSTPTTRPSVPTTDRMSDTAAPVPQPASITEEPCLKPRITGAPEIRLVTETSVQLVSPFVPPAQRALSSPHAAVDPMTPIRSAPVGFVLVALRTARSQLRKFRVN